DYVLAVSAWFCLLRTSIARDQPTGSPLFRIGSISRFTPISLTHNSRVGSSRCSFQSRIGKPYRRVPPPPHGSPFRMGPLRREVYWHSHSNGAHPPTIF